MFLLHSLLIHFLLDCLPWINVFLNFIPCKVAWIWTQLVIYLQGPLFDIHKSLLKFHKIWILYWWNVIKQFANFWYMSLLYGSYQMFATLYDQLILQDLVINTSGWPDCLFKMLIFYNYCLWFLFTKMNSSWKNLRFCLEIIFIGKKSIQHNLF